MLYLLGLLPAVCGMIALAGCPPPWSSNATKSHSNEVFINAYCYFVVVAFILHLLVRCFNLRFSHQIRLDYYSFTPLAIFIFIAILFTTSTTFNLKLFLYYCFYSLTYYYFTAVIVTIITIHLVSFTSTIAYYHYCHLLSSIHSHYLINLNYCFSFFLLVVVSFSLGCILQPGIPPLQ